MYKNTLIVLTIIIVAIIGFAFTFTRQEKPAVVAPLNEKAMVEDYVRANIKDVATDKAVLGGTWYVVSINVDEVANRGQVVYEDGHIQSVGVFDYKFNIATGAVTIEQFEVVQPSTIPKPKPTACTMDAMQCPDRSYVGRTGSKCEFVCPQRIEGFGKGTVRGRITLSPICPVELNPPDPNCAPKGYKTNVAAKKNGQVVTSTTSDTNGEYKFTLAPGILGRS